MEAGYKAHIVTPSAIQQYKGLKFTNDYSDASWLADMLRLRLLPEGYILPREQRLLRDLLRKRGQLVQQRTRNVLSVKNLFLRALCYEVSSYAIKKMTNSEVDALVHEGSLNLSIKSSLSIIRCLKVEIRAIEKDILQKAKDNYYFQQLLKVKGIGEVLALSMSLEVENLKRFADAGHFASYCRCVPSKRISNGKSKGENNRKNGNKYLAWTFIEAAQLVKKHCPYARKFYEKKKKSSGKTVVAIKALANKLAKACFYIMRDGVAYDGTKIYKGNLTEKDIKAVAAKTKRGLAEKPPCLIGKAATAPSD
jgi:transposase